MSAATEWVPVSALPTLERRVARLAERAERLGASLELEDLGDRRVRGDGLEEARVRIEGVGGGVEGWHVAARLHHDDDETEVEVLDGRSPPSTWVNAAPACEHCQLARRRSTTYLLRHESGELAQVGSSCVADFVGGRDPLDRLTGYARLRSSARSALEEAAGSAERIPIAEFLAHVAAVASEGFVSRKAAERDGVPSTAELALARWRSGEVIPGRARGEGEAVERWVLTELKTRRTLSDFEGRMLAVFELSELMAPERAPLVASAWLAWKRARGREQLGEVGAEIECDVDVVQVAPTRSSRGKVVWHELRDRDGHELAWFAVGSQLEAGSRYRIRGEVCRHDRFAGVARTVLDVREAVEIGGEERP